MSAKSCTTISVLPHTNYAGNDFIIEKRSKIGKMKRATTRTPKNNKEETGKDSF
jgi:hypothetical protein